MVRLRPKVGDSVGNQNHQAFAQGKDGARVDLNGVRAQLRALMRTHLGKVVAKEDPRLRELADTLVVAGGSGDRDPARLRRQAEVQAYNAAGWAGASLAKQLFREKAIVTAQQNHRNAMGEREDSIHEDLGLRLARLDEALARQDARAAEDQTLSVEHLSRIHAGVLAGFINSQQDHLQLESPVDVEVLAHCLGDRALHTSEGLDVEAFSRAWAKRMKEEEPEDPEYRVPGAQAEGARIAQGINQGILAGYVPDLAACGGVLPSKDIATQMQEYAELKGLDPLESNDHLRIHAIAHPLGMTGALAGVAQDGMNRAQVYWNTAGVLPRKMTSTAFKGLGAGVTVAGSALEMGVGVGMGLAAMLYAQMELASGAGKDLANGRGPSVNLTSEALFGIGAFRAVREGATGIYQGVKQGVTAPAVASQEVDAKVDRVRSRSQASLHALQGAFENALRNAKEGLENHQMYCNLAKKLFEEARVVATAPDEDTGTRAVERMKGLKIDMEALLEAMRTDTPSLAWALENHPQLRLSAIAAQADTVAAMGCMKNERLRGVLMKAGFSEMDPKGGKAVSPHGEFSGVMDWGASADPNAVREHLAKHDPVLRDELGPGFYRAPRLAVQATPDGQVNFYVVASKRGGLGQMLATGTMVDDQFGAAGTAPVRMSMDRLQAILNHLEREARDGVDAEARLSTLKGREVVVDESGRREEVERTLELWSSTHPGQEGLTTQFLLKVAGSDPLEIGPARLKIALEQVNEAPKDSDPEEVRWLRVNLRDGQLEPLKALVEDHVQLAWVRQNLTGAQQAAAAQLVATHKQIGGIDALRGLNPYHQTLVKQINGKLAGDPSAAGLTLDPVHLERILTKPLADAAAISQMRTGMAFREAFHAAHEIAEEQAAFDAYFLYAQSQAEAAE